MNIFYFVTETRKQYRRMYDYVSPSVYHKDKCQAREGKRNLLWEDFVEGLVLVGLKIGVEKTWICKGSRAFLAKVVRTTCFHSLPILSNTIYLIGSMNMVICHRDLHSRDIFQLFILFQSWLNQGGSLSLRLISLSHLSFILFQKEKAELWPQILGRSPYLDGLCCYLLYLVFTWHSNDHGDSSF